MDVAQPLDLGAIERKPDNRDILLGAVQAPVAIPETPPIDFSWLKRNYQGQTPTCGAHALTHFQAVLLHALDSSKTSRFSPRFSWIRIKAIDGFPLDAGTD